MQRQAKSFQENLHKKREEVKGDILPYFLFIDVWDSNSNSSDMFSLLEKSS